MLSSSSYPNAFTKVIHAYRSLSNFIWTVSSSTTLLLCSHEPTNLCMVVNLDFAWTFVDSTVVLLKLWVRRVVVGCRAIWEGCNVFAGCHHNIKPSKCCFILFQAWCSTHGWLSCCMLIMTKAHHLRHYKPNYPWTKATFLSVEPNHSLTIHFFFFTFLIIHNIMMFPCRSLTH